MTVTVLPVASSIAGVPVGHGAVDHTALKRAVHRRLVLEHADGPALDHLALRERLATLVRDEHPLMPATRVQRLVDELVDEVAGLGPLEPWLG